MIAIRRAAERASRLPSWVQALLAFLAYLVASVLLFGLPVVGHLSTVWVGTGTADAKLYAWDLVWWPHSLTNGLDPLWTRVVFAPTGANLMWVTSLPAPSLLMAPVTMAFGPVVSSNVLALLGPAGAGWAAYLVCRRLTTRFWPAFVGGLLFGFSTYVTTATRGHLNLSLVAAVPLAVYLVLRRADGSMAVAAFVPLLALDLAAQFLTSTEVFATMSVFGVVSMLLALLLVPGRRRTVVLGAQVAAAYAVAAVLLLPFLLAVARDVPIHPLKDIAPASADLLGFALPRPTILFGHDLAEATTSRFTARPGEDGSYLGIPLLLVVLLGLTMVRRDAAMRLLVAAFVVFAVAALGPTLHIAGRVSVAMPWAIARDAPLLENALPVRFSMYVALAAAALAARWLGSGGRLVWARWALVLVGVAALIPRVTDEWHTRVHVPAFFANGIYRDYIARGETIVLLPVTQSMLWQAQTDMYFSMATGRFGTAPPGFSGWTVARRFRYSSIGPGLLGQVRAFLAEHDVRAIVVADSQAAAWRKTLAPLGIAPVHVDGVDVYDVTAVHAAPTPLPTGTPSLPPA